MLGYVVVLGGYSFSDMELDLRQSLYPLQAFYNRIGLPISVEGTFFLTVCIVLLIVWMMIHFSKKQRGNQNILPPWGLISPGGSIFYQIFLFRFLLLFLIKVNTPALRRVAFCQQLFYIVLYELSPKQSYKVQNRVSLCLGNQISVSYVERGYSPASERTCPSNL